MSAETITATAIDAYLFIESVRVVNRHRTDLGNMQALMDSIEDVGLLNPITVTSDSRLVAGQRRIEACRRLGWDSVPVRVAANLDEAARLLRAERDENLERKEMLPSEKASLGEALLAIEAEKARERQRQAGREFGRGIASDERGTSYPERGGEPGSEQNKARSVVGEALGMSGSSYGDLRFVHRVANGMHHPSEPAPAEDIQRFAQSCMAEIDRTGKIARGSKSLRAKMRARHDAEEAKAAALAEPEPEPGKPERRGDELDPSWIPPGRDSSLAAVAQRHKLIAHHAGRGLSSRQIAEVVGITAERVRDIGKKHDIPIPADALVGRQRRIDSNRVVRETVYALEGAAMSAQLVITDELDRDEITAWAESLTTSIRTLNRLVKQLKEMAS